MEFFNAVNSFLWVSANVLLAYSSVVLVIFLVAYYLIFDPRATTGGRMIFQFILSLAGLIMINIMGVFIDPSADNQWYVYPDDVQSWRPIMRFAVYGFVAYAISSLAILLAMRKWWPHKLRKASDINLVKVRHTAEIPTIDNSQFDRK